jgi:CDP-diacylglycerol--glycerol-3-phosphate 3-phosphatidyltransferase
MHTEPPHEQSTRAAGPGVMTRHLTIPNQLTILRILLVPVIGAVLAIDFTDHYQIGAFAYVTAAATDTLDGRIARSRNLVTELGKFLDPLADKLLVITVLVILATQSLLPSWVVVVVAAREFLITGLRSVAAAQGVVVSSTPWGKSKTLTQNCMILLIILAQPYPWLMPAAVTFIWIAVIATVLSGLDYLWRYRRFVI